MINTIIYVMLMIVFLIINYKKASSIGKVLMLLYTVCACFTFLIAINDTTKLVSLDEAKLWPYIFLICVYAVSFSPYVMKDNGFKGSKFGVEVNKNYIIFTLIYIVLGFVAIMCFIPKMRDMVIANNWLDSYGIETQYPYSNIFEYIAMNFCSYFRLLAIIIGFALFRGRVKEEKKYTILSLSVIVIAVVSAIGEAVIATSRSMFFDIGIIVISVYVFFFQETEKNRKRFVTVLILLALPFMLSVFYNISVARFQTRGVNDYFIYYMGHSPIVFNSQLVTKLETIMFGKHAFGGLFGLTNLSPTRIGATCGTRFITYVGWLYVDWGLLSIFIMWILARTVKQFIQKDTYKVSDLFLIFSYYQFLTKGVFVIGTEYYYTIIAFIIIFSICRFIERTRFVIHRS